MASELGKKFAEGGSTKLGDGHADCVTPNKRAQFLSIAGHQKIAEGPTTEVKPELTHTPSRIATPKVKGGRENY